MSNEEMAMDIQAGATGRMVDLWEQVEGFAVGKQNKL